MTTTIPLSVTLHLHPSQSSHHKLTTLLQSGFLQPINGQISITDLLVSLPGFDLPYLEERVQTIFVNGLAEDDIYRQLADGDTLALSAAMPGLAGAIFRRGGQHASLRTKLKKNTSIPSKNTGYVTLKLFNMIARETGPELLRNGILIKGKNLSGFLERQKNDAKDLLQKIEVDGVKTTYPELLSLIADQDVLSLHSK